MSQPTRKPATCCSPLPPSLFIENHACSCAFSFLCWALLSLCNASRLRLFQLPIYQDMCLTLAMADLQCLLSCCIRAPHITDQIKKEVRHPQASIGLSGHGLPIVLFSWLWVWWLCPAPAKPNQHPAWGRVQAMNLNSWDDADLSMEVLRLRLNAAGRKRHHLKAARQPIQPSSTQVQGKRSRSASVGLGAAPSATQAQKVRHAEQQRAKRRRMPAASVPRPLAASWAAVCFSKAGPKISVGTECSGLESVMAAFDQMGLGDRAQLQFICEKYPAARKLILAHRCPKVVFHDITTRPVQKMPVCDIYAAGFPCQPWSAAGLREGTNDRQGRGKIFFHIHQYIRNKAPKCFLLENVKGLTMVTHRDTFAAYLKSLRDGLDNKYIVSWRVLNTADFGLPQNRPRLYIIGIQHAVLQGRQLPPFQWPRTVGCVPLASVLESGPVQRQQPRPNTVAEKNLRTLQHRLMGNGNVPSTPVALDIFASKPRTMIGKVPCLTRTRAGSGGYWITGVNGLLTTREMLRLQGLPECLIKIAKTAGVSERQLCQMIGNAMSVNVLVVILSRLLPALGLS